MEGRLVSVADVMDDVIAFMDFPGEFIYVNGEMDLGERFRAIKHNYRRKQAMVAAGIDDWFMSDPYEIAHWLSIFTPIEEALWSDIRRWGLDLWPQLPVGRFFVDFGNPVAKLAVECDGAQWHQDKAKDAARDQEMEKAGWTVLRIPGYQCKTEILTAAEAEEKGISDYEGWRDQKTPYTSLCMARDHLRWRKEKVRRERSRHE